MPLQRIYYNFMEQDAVGENEELLDLGDLLVDGWLTRVELIGTSTTSVTVNAINVVSIGVDTQPNTMSTVLADAAVDSHMRNPLLNMFSDSVDAMAWHGSDYEMPLFHVLRGVSADDFNWHYKKLFRRPVHAGDTLGLWMISNSVSGAADVAGQFTIEGFCEQVIAPRRWD